MSQQLTITRALAELKLLDKRITKTANSSTFVSWRVSGRDVANSRVNDAKSEHKSVTDLIKRYNAIKSAIAVSNALTKVTISGVEYTVAEAITRKQSIDYDRMLLHSLICQNEDVMREIQSYESNVNHKLEALLQKNFSNQNKKTDDIQTITDAYLKSNKAERVDPLDVEKKIKNLQTDIDNFTTEVDYVLSESNAKTTIEV